MSKKKRGEEICPECWNGCMACFNAGKSHVRPVMEQLESARALLAQRDGELEALRAVAQRVVEAWMWDDPETWDSEEWYNAHDDLVAALSDNPESPALTDKEA